jgi:hypothetical protein
MLWIGGIGLYHAISQLAPSWGAALPTLVVTIALAKLSSKSVAQGTPAKA